MSISASYSPLVSKIYTSRKVILDLLARRGFDVEDYAGTSVNDVHIMHSNKQLDMLLTHPETKQNLFVKYHLATRCLPKNVYELVDDLFDVEEVLKPGDELIIVTKERMNDTLRNLIKEIYLNDSKFVNVYNLNDYLLNILNHDLVAPHKVLSRQDAGKVAMRYNITDRSQFPEISRFDPVAQAIGLRPGQLCEITRRSPTAVRSRYWRFCY
jgi:DNA-directed RNA polymerase subunit H